MYSDVGLHTFVYAFTFCDDTLMFNRNSYKSIIYRKSNVNAKCATTIDTKKMAELLVNEKRPRAEFYLPG